MSLQSLAPMAMPDDPADAARIQREEAAYVEEDRNLNTEIRESVNRAIQGTFPRPIAVLLDAIVTYISGCPHRLQQPLVERGVRAYTIEALGGFVLGVALGHVAVVYRLWPVLPILWLFVAGRMWAIFAIMHHATHNTLFRSKRLNRLVSQTGTLMVFASGIDNYRREHISSHHTNAMCTYEDEEAVFMPLGFPPGLSRERYWKLLWKSLLSPGYYLKYTRFRLWDWPLHESRWRRLAVWSFAIALVACAWAFGLLTSLALAYFVPVFLVFNVTGLLGTFSLHHWGGLLHRRPRERLVLLCQSRYLLDPAPAPELPWTVRLRSWTRWWARLLFYHLPVRVAVLPSESIIHDHHHRHPHTERWTRGTFERAEHIWNGCPGFPDLPHRHAWSLGEAIERVFLRMEAAPPPELAKRGYDKRVPEQEQERELAPAGVGP